MTAPSQPADRARPQALLQGLGPVLDADTRLIVLGSFPGVASLRAQGYYAYPQNHFWKILAALWGLPLHDMPYTERIDALLAHGLGLWDVYAACEREGSLDSRIRHGRLNDLHGLRARCPRLQAIAHNGAESHRHARHTQALGLPVYRLPSTSPANAGWSFERKLQAWREVLARHGLAGGAN